jgi:hypothetical protein
MSDRPDREPPGPMKATEPMILVAKDDDIAEPEPSRDLGDLGRLDLQVEVEHRRGHPDARGSGGGR